MAETRRAVLVADDDEAMRDLLVGLLADAGIDAEGVADGSEALARIAARRFDAVISDVQMPRKGGLELLRELHLSRPALPVILMTGLSSGVISRVALASGAFELLRKPFQLREVLASLRRAFDAEVQVAAS
jgi:DNA-binding NtrC family response regulator